MTTLPLLDDVIECSCGICVSACHKKPGWFLPEEIKPAADFLGLTEKEFFDKYLAVDYYMQDDMIYVLSPAVVGQETGKEFPLDPLGRCVFLKDDKCSIHAVKPHECRSYDHRNENNKELHLKVAEEWIPHKNRIKELLGRDPCLEKPTIFDLLELMKSVYK